MSTPLVSVLVPCHNAARWLRTCLDSVLQQTWPRIEVIVVDDGSTDESKAVIAGYAPRGVVLVEQDRRGAAAARNAALRRATGDYIQFLDADDLLHPDKLKRQVSRLQHEPAGTLASGEWARFWSEPEEARFVADPLWEDLTGLEFQLRRQEGALMMQPNAWLSPRPLLDRCGPWNEELSLDDDGEYFTRVTIAASGIVFCPGARTYYRSGQPGSLSRRTSGAALASLFRSTELSTAQLLAAAAHSRRAQAAAAVAWQRVAFECCPQCPDLSRAAEQRSRRLGGFQAPFPAGPRFHHLARLIGWRRAKRLRDLSLPWRRPPA